MCTVPDRGQDCAAVPVVVWVHGGAFATGDKANFAADKVDLFNDAGWAFASVNYRLPTRHTPYPSHTSRKTSPPPSRGSSRTPTTSASTRRGSHSSVTPPVRTSPRRWRPTRIPPRAARRSRARHGRFAPSTRLPVNPLLLVTRGSPSRMSANAAFADAIVAAGGEATVVDAEPYRHEDVNEPSDAPATRS